MDVVIELLKYKKTALSGGGCDS